LLDDGPLVVSHHRTKASSTRLVTKIRKV
jgi:hypothetical protein